MAAASYDIILEQDSDFSETLTLTLADRVTPAFDLTGCIIESNLFKSGTQIGSFVCTVTDGPNAKFKRTLSHTFINTLTPSAVANYIHSVNVTFVDGTKKRLIKGKVTVSAEGV